MRTLRRLMVLALGLACAQPATPTMPARPPVPHAAKTSALGSADGWILHYATECIDRAATLGSKIVCLRTNWLSNASVSETWEGDGRTWVLRLPSVSPPRRAEHAMATLGSKVVMFGGGSGFDSTGQLEGPLDDTWEWDGNTWQERSSTMRPPARLRPLLASVGNKVVLFGGDAFADTWEWDGANWSEKTPASSPAGCNVGDCSLVGVGSKAVLFNAGTRQTWEWDGTAWSQRDASGPVVGHGFGMAALGDRIIVFGGYGQSGSQDETWIWDGDSWTQAALTEHPPRRVIRTMVTLGNKILVLGGYDTNGMHEFDDVWSWDGLVWAQVLPDSQPPTRHQCAMAAANDRLAVFGGATWLPDSDLADTWEWDGAVWTPASAAVEPPARRSHAMASLGGKAVLFGGRQNSVGLLGDTWEWDGHTWTDKAPSVSPSAREGHAMASSGTKIVLFGGRDASASNLGDTWEWDGANWTQVFPATSPSPRSSHLMATNGSGKVVMFGDDRGGNETWEWDGSNWNKRAPATVIPGEYSYDLDHMATFDGHVILVQHGSCSEGRFVWEWDGSDWRRIESPSPSFLDCGFVVGCMGALSDRIVLPGPAGLTWEYRSTQSLGSACANASECNTPFCVDGVCCDSPCAGQCEACNLVGREGTCSPVFGAPVGGRLACASDGSPCGGICDGVHRVACVYPGADVLCGAPSCAFGSATLASVCDGAGACPPSQTDRCAPYACAGDSCATSCASDADCYPGNGCANGACGPLWSNAHDCTGSRECLSGHCADGVCCESACDGQCEACDVNSSVGMCATVDGPPRGDRAACRTGFECRAGACKAVVALAGGGCGCAASGEAGSMLLVAGSLIALLSRRRRREGQPGNKLAQTTGGGPMRGSTGVSTLLALAIVVVACAQRATQEPRTSTPASRGVKASALGSPERWVYRDDPGCSGPAAALGSKAVVVCDRVDSDASVVETWEFDGLTWTLKLPPTSPSFRSGSSVAKLGSKVVLFGGNAFDPAAGKWSSYFDETWEWDGTTWTQRQPVTRPPARAGALMVSYGARILLTGGSDASNELTDTWEWNGAEWVDRTTAITPSIGGGWLRASAAMLGDKVVLLNPAYQTWEWDGATWTLSSVAGPPVTGAMAALGNRVLLVGSRASSPALESWQWDGGSWTQLSGGSGPLARNLFDLVEVEGRVVLWGGIESTHRVLQFNDSWWWSWTDKVWTQLLPNRSPTPREEGSFAAVGDRAVLFGGLGASSVEVLGDTWVWDGAVWSQDLSTPSPSPRAGHAMATLNGKVVLVGVARLCLDDMWEWDETGWTQIVTVNSPSPRNQHAMATLGDRIILFGGRSCQGATYGDTWAWDGTNWTQLFPATSPSPRYGHAMASLGDKVVMFGDGQSGAETWEFDGSNWTMRTPAISPPRKTQDAWYSMVGLGSRVLLYEGQMAQLPNGVRVPYGTWTWDGMGWTQVDLPGTSQLMGWIPPGGCVGSIGDTAVLFSALLPSGVWEFRSQQSLGSACSSGSECSSPYCINGICCDSPCAGQCEACNLVGREGTCSPVFGAPVGGRPACASDRSPCGGICDGVHRVACVYPGADVLCGAPNCAFGSATLGSVCDGAGACPPSQTDVCAPYACAGDSCATSCASDAECAPGNGCANGACGPLWSNAHDCAASRECLSGHCVDGVCCESACDGQCEACNANSSFGMCVNVDGPPRGDRAACRTGFECRAGACKAVVALTGGGCGCAASGEAGSMLLVAGSLIALLRRRRRVLVSAGQESR